MPFIKIPTHQLLSVHNGLKELDKQDEKGVPLNLFDFKMRVALTHRLRVCKDIDDALEKTRAGMLSKAGLLGLDMRKATEEQQAAFVKFNEDWRKVIDEEVEIGTIKYDMLKLEENKKISSGALADLLPIIEGFPTE